MLASKLIEADSVISLRHSAVEGLLRSIDIEAFWKSTLGLIQSALSTHSCSLLLNISNYEPCSGRHHVERPIRPGYLPATSLSVSTPFLAAHPRVKLYTYSQIVSQDPHAHARRAAQEEGAEEWSEFAHLAFWDGAHPYAVLSVRRGGTTQPHFDAEELGFLERIHPLIDAALARLRSLDHERRKLLAYEHLLRRSSVSVLVVDARGGVLFSNPEGLAMCERWNRSLRGTAARSEKALRLPEDAGLLVARLDPIPDEEAAVMPHPRDASLKVSVMKCPQEQGVEQNPSYILRFQTTQARTLSARAVDLLDRLTRSERQVAILVAEGMRNEEIARRLSRSRRTIECQLYAIYGKLNISSRTQLVLALV